jgi:hypothetical protein
MKVNLILSILMFGIGNFSFASNLGPVYVELGGSQRTALFDCIEQVIRDKYNLPVDHILDPGPFGTAYDVTWISRPYLSHFANDRATMQLIEYAPEAPLNPDEAPLYERVRDIHIGFKSVDSRWSIVTYPGSPHEDWYASSLEILTEADLAFDDYTSNVTNDKIDLMSCQQQLQTQPEEETL